MKTSTPSGCDNCSLRPVTFSLHYAVFAVLLLKISGPVHSQISNSPLPNFWIADSQVNAIVETNGVVYLGGNFRYVGPNTGPGGVVNAATGAPDTGWPRVSGDLNLALHWVNEVIPDGAGGWYVAGGFRYAGPLDRPGVVRLNSDKTVATNFNANVSEINNEVYALALSGNTLYLGGVRMVFPGVFIRQGLAAVDKTTGALSSWNPQSSPAGESWSVGAIAVSGSTVYFSGGFTNVGGQARRSLAAVDTTTGAPTAWNPNATNATIGALIVSNTTVYVSGRFPSGVGGAAGLRHLAALDATTGNALWAVTVTNTGGFVGALTLSGNTLYVGGNFTNIAGSARRALAALDAATGSVLAWNPGADTASLIFAGPATINAIAVSGNTVYVGGDIGFAGGQTRLNLAALDATTGNALPGFQAAAAKAVSALAVSGNLLYAGCRTGGSDSIGGEIRNGLAALNATTGAATGWNPSPTNSRVTVNALAVDDSTVYVGGSFTNIGGLARKSIAAVDANTGAIGSWNPNPFTIGSSPPLIQTLLRSGNLLYVGGSFTNIGGQVRRNLAALTNSTATASPWDPNANNRVNAMALDGTNLYACGQFTSIGGQSRNYLAALDTTTGNASGWNPNPNSFGVYTLAVRSNTVYVGGDFTAIGGSTNRALAALDTTSGLATAWNPNAPLGAGIQGIALASNSLFVAGNFATIGGSNRYARAELSLPTAGASAWNPTNFVSSSGSGTGQGQVVVLGAANVYAGGLFPGFFATYSRGLSSPSGTPPMLTMPMWSGGGFSFRLLGSNGVSHTIQATVDFQSWSNIGVVVPSGGFADFTDSNSPSYQRRDYRARVGP